MRLPFSCIALSALLASLFARDALATAAPVHGTLPAEVRAALDAGLLELPDRGPSLTTSIAQPEWRIPVILVAYSDVPLAHSAAALRTALFDTLSAMPYGSASQYWSTVSSGRLRLRGEVVGTLTMPHGIEYYSNGAYGVNVLSTPNNAYGLLRDAVANVDDAVDWTRFDLDADGFVDMLWLVHAGPGGETTGQRRDLWSITSRAAGTWNNGGAIETEDLVPGSANQRIRIDRFSVLPELSGFVPGGLCEIGVYCHEFGHALGLPDLYDASTLGGGVNVGPGHWALMSTGAYGGDGRSPARPVHLGAWPMLFLGWADRVRPLRDSTITLAPLTRGGPITELWFEGENNPEHFLIENRQREGVDASLPQSGLMVYQVDEALIGTRLISNRVNSGPYPALRVLEGDGDFDMQFGVNRGDEGDPLPGREGRLQVDDDTSPSLRTQLGYPTSCAILDITPIGANVRARYRVQAPGWGAPATRSPAGWQPLPSLGPARRGLTSRSGDLLRVGSELVNGKPQVVLRARSVAGQWTSEVVSSSPVGAVEPSITALPGGDLAVAWSDARAARRQVGYRARVNGRWGPERLLPSAGGDASLPAIGADTLGRVTVAWLDQLGVRSTIAAMRFGYLSPFGQPLALSGLLDRPSPPTVETMRAGPSWVVWSERSTTPQHLAFVRWNPDSAPAPRQRLTPVSPGSEPSFSTAMDGSENLHIVWQSAGAGGSEIRHLVRSANGVPSRDSLVESRGNDMQNPVIAIDAEGGQHVAWEQTGVAGIEVRYKRRKPADRWDIRGTPLATPADGSTVQPTLYPISPGRLTAVWTSTLAGATRLIERRRELDGPVVLAAPTANSPRERLALSLSRNPIRAGDAIRILFSSPVRVRERLELFDAAGRRRFTHELPVGAVDARLGAQDTQRLAPGLYFARLASSEVATRIVVLR